MIELHGDTLIFSFPEISSDARCYISFRKTLRVPDDGVDYPLPAGFEKFPLRHMDDYSRRMPDSVRMAGGVMLPLHRAEAMYIDFDGHEVEDRGVWPCLVKVGVGKVNAITGEAWDSPVSFDPQDHVVVPEQSWLDGFAVSPGRVRQFVAVPAGEGYSPEEQLWGQMKVGGIQIQVSPMKRIAFERHFSLQEMIRFSYVADPMFSVKGRAIGLGGRIRQKVHKNPYKSIDWETSRSSRCFVHLVAASDWARITGERTPTLPPTAAQYSKNGLPWFSEYSEPSSGIAGSKLLAGLKSVFGLDQGKSSPVLPENESAKPRIVREAGKQRSVREGEF